MPARPLVLIGLCVALAALATRVGSFERVRRGVEVVDAGAATEWRVTLPGIGTADAPWRVVTIDFANGPVPGRLEARVEDATTTASLAAGERHRLTILVAAPRTTTLQLALTSPTASGRVEGVTISNAYGFTRTIVGLTVLPRAQPHPAPPLVTWLLTMAAAGLAWVGAGRAGPRSRLARVAAAACAALLVAAIASPFVSEYRLVVSPRTYVLALVAGVAAVLPWPLMAEAWRTRVGIVAASLAGAVFFGSAMVQQLALHDGNYSGFLHMPAERAASAPFLRERPDLVRTLVLGDESYDAQFMYLMAFDPALRRFADDPARYREVVDFPPYRFGRIGYSWLTAAAALGRPERFPAAMMWLVVGGHLVLGLALALLARQAGASPWLALLYPLIPGYMASLQFGLPESLASAGLVAGVYSWLRDRRLLAAILFAGAILIRETGVLLAIACIVAMGSVPWRTRAWWCAAALLPVAAWRAYVAVVLWPDFGAAALAPNPGILGWPAAGLARLVEAAATGAHARSEVRAAMTLPLLLGAGAVLLVARWKTVPRGLALASLAYTVMALSLDYAHVWQHVPSGERASIECFLAWLLVTIVGAGRDGPGRTAACFWGVAAVYTFFVSPEAALSRAALGVLH